jgi:hypothetical protein
MFYSLGTWIVSVIRILICSLKNCWFQKFHPENSWFMIPGTKTWCG